MVTSVGRGTPLGLAYGQVFLTGSNGVAYGKTGEGAAVDSTLNAHLLDGLKVATLPDPQRVVATITGGNRWRGSMMFGVNEIGSFPVTMMDVDAVLMAFTSQSAVDNTSNTRWRRFSNNLNLVTPPSCGLVLTADFQSKELDSDGTPLFINYIIPRCQIAIALPASTYQAAAEITMTVTPTMAIKEPHGRLFSAGAMALSKNRAPMYCIVGPKPIGITTYIADGVETTFTLGYKPTSSIITINAAANEAVKNGTLTALTSVSTTTALATLPAAGSSGDIWGVMYETDFEAVA